MPQISRKTGIFSAEEWAQKAKAEPEWKNRPVSHTLGIEAVEKGPDGSRELTFTISTDSIDRQGDRIQQDGWDFTAYLKNPVVLWGHDYDELPVARTLSIWVESNRTKARVEFAPAEVNPFAEQVYQSYKSGFLSAVSVGFLPREWKWAEGPDRMYGIDFVKQELMEFSCVTVPANAEALLESRSVDSPKMKAKQLTPGAYALILDSPLRPAALEGFAKSIKEQEVRLGVKFLVLEGVSRIEPLYVGAEQPAVDQREREQQQKEIQQRRAIIEALRG